MIYKVIGYEYADENTKIIKYGEIGDKFYVLLQGSASVRIPSIVEKYFTLQELLCFLLENKEWLVHNDKLQNVYEVIQDILPELIKSNFQGEMSMNYSLAAQVIASEVLLPSQIEMKNFEIQFSKKEKYKNLVNDSLLLSLNLMMEVDKFHPGQSFGELALINNIKRTATITTLENCHFGVIDKENFDKIMSKIIKKKFEK